MVKNELNRFEAVKSMNCIVKSLVNEDAYFRWIEVVPDEATDEDIADLIADEELFADTIRLFKEIMRDYLNYGLYIADVLY